MYEYIAYKCYARLLRAMSSKTTILIGHETRDLLKRLGGKGMTYDAIILELIRKNGVSHP